MRYEIVYRVALYCGLTNSQLRGSEFMHWQVVFKLHVRYQKSPGLVGYLGQH